GPGAKVCASERTTVRMSIIIQKAIEVSEEFTTGPASVGTTASIGAATLGSLPGFIARLVSRLVTRLLAIGLAAWLRVRLAFSLSHFALQLFGQLIQFLLCQAQGLGVIAQHTFGCPLDAGLEFVDCSARSLDRIGRLPAKIVAQHLGSDVQQFSAVMLGGLLQ